MRTIAEVRETSGGGAVSRVLFTRLTRGTVISLGRRSPACSSGLPAAGSGPGRASPPIWPCSDWGLPCHDCCQPRGGLLPHRFTLTRLASGGLFSVALSVALRRPGVTWQSALRSSDFPRPAETSRDHRAPPPSGRYQDSDADLAVTTVVPQPAAVERRLRLTRNLRSGHEGRAACKPPTSSSQP